MMSPMKMMHKIHSIAKPAAMTGLSLMFGMYSV